MLMVRQSSAGAGLTREDIRGLVHNLVAVMVGLILLVLEAGPAKGWPVSIGP